MTSRRTFQAVLVLSGLFVVATGALDIVTGTALLPDSREIPVNVDSQYRFFASIWLTLGAVLLWIVPRPEQAVGPLRAVCGAVFLGGLARLLSLAVAGVPHPMFLAFIVIELVVPPALVIWQNRLTRTSPEPRP